MTYEKHYYGGEWQASSGTETIPVISSATEQEFSRVPRGAAADVDRAVKAARRGFASWSRLPVEERAQWLEKLSAAMKTRVPQIAEAIAHEVGTAIGFATKVQAEFPIMMIGMNAKFIREAKLEEELGNSLVIKEPIGGYPSACDPCSWAMAVPGVPHGRVASYRHAGCRCPECRRANRENEHARKLQGGRPADAAPALAGTPSESSASSDPSGGFPVGNDGNAGAAIYEAHGLLSEWQAAVDARLRAEFPEEEGAA